MLDKEKIKAVKPSERQFKAEYYGRRVKVYFNLHTFKFSVKDAKLNIVLFHCNGIVLNNVTYQVGKAGRDRVRQEGVKNVHAYVCGEIDSLNTRCFNFDNFTQLYYRPEDVDNFVLKNDWSVNVWKSDFAVMDSKKVFIEGAK